MPMLFIYVNGSKYRDIIGEARATKYAKLYLSAGHRWYYSSRKYRHKMAASWEI